MAKIENDAKTPPARRTFVVEVSFDGLDKGERFHLDADDVTWAEPHVKAGYLREVFGEEPGVERSQVSQG